MGFDISISQLSHQPLLDLYMGLLWIFPAMFIDINGANIAFLSDFTDLSLLYQGPFLDVYGNHIPHLLEAPAENLFCWWFQQPL